MAPNRKNVDLIATHFATLQVVRPKDYQPQQPPVDTASYWEWPTTQSDPADVLSTDCIVSNLAKSKVAEKKSATAPSSDDYWAEQDVVDEPSVAAPQEQINSNDYWAEASHENASIDDYWNTNAAVPPFPKAPVTTVRNPAVNPSYSAAYWQEVTHTSSKIDYWAESRPSESADGDYWSWKAPEHRPSDNYWNWSSIRAV